MRLIKASFFLAACCTKKCWSVLVLLLRFCSDWKDRIDCFPRWAKGERLPGNHFHRVRLADFASEAYSAPTNAVLEPAS